MRLCCIFSDPATIDCSLKTLNRKLFTALQNIARGHKVHCFDYLSHISVLECRICIQQPALLCLISCLEPLEVSLLQDKNLGSATKVVKFCLPLFASQVTIFGLS